MWGIGASAVLGALIASYEVHVSERLHERREQNGVAEGQAGIADAHSHLEWANDLWLVTMAMALLGAPEMQLQTVGLRP